MFTREVSPGIWSNLENLTVYLEEWNWPSEVAITLQPGDIPRVFWYQSYYDEMMQPAGEGMYTSFKADGSWHDDTGVLQGRTGSALDTATGAQGMPVYAWVEKDGGIYRLLLNLPRPASTTPGPLARGALRLSAYPNPSDGALSISWSAPDGWRVALELFDIHGRSVTSLFRGRPGEPDGTLLWSPRDASGGRLSDGIYFLRLATDTGTRTERIVRMTPR